MIAEMLPNTASRTITGITLPLRCASGTVVALPQGKCNAPEPRQTAPGQVVGVAAFSSSLRGLRLVPSKWRPLIPGEHRDGAQSRPPALITLIRALRKRKSLAIFFAHNNCVLPSSPLESVFRLPLGLGRVELIL